MPTLLDFDSDTIILLERVRRADKVVRTIAAAYMSYLNGHREGWSAIEEKYGVIALTYKTVASTDFRKIKNNDAQVFCFKQWFMEDTSKSASGGAYKLTYEDMNLLDKCDHDTYHMLLELGDKHDWYDRESDNTNLQDKYNYILAIAPYLSKYLIEVTTAPIMKDIRSRATANFMWYIKFERTFKRSEGKPPPIVNTTPQLAQVLDFTGNDRPIDPNAAGELVTNKTLRWKRMNG